MPENITKKHPVAIILIVFSILTAITGQIFIYNGNVFTNYFLSNLLDKLIAPDISIFIGIIFYLASIFSFIWLLKLYPFSGYIDSLDPISATNNRKPFSVPRIILYALVVVLLLLFSLLIIYKLDTNSNISYYNLIWLTTILIGGILIIILERKLPDFSLLKIDKAEFFFLFMAILFTISYLLPFIETIPYHFHGDEAQIGNYARKIIFNGAGLSELSGWYGVPNLSFFPAYFSMTIFGNNLFGLRISNILLAIISIPVFYLTIKIIFNKEISAISTIIFLSSYIFFFYFRPAFHHSQGAIAFIFSTFFLFLGLKTNNKLMFYISGTLVAFGFYLYFSARVIIVIIIIFFLILLIQFWKNKVFLLKQILSFILGLLIILTPILIASVNNKSLAISRGSSVCILTEEGFKYEAANQNTNNLALIAFNNIRKAFLSFHFYNDRSGHYQFQRPFVDIISSVFLLMGILVILPNLRNIKLLYYAIFFFTIVLIGWGLTCTPPNSQRLVIILPVISTLTALSIYYIKELISKLSSAKRFKNLFVYSILLLIVFSNFETIYYYVTFNSFTTWTYKTRLLYSFISNLKDKNIFYVVSYNNSPGNITDYYSCPAHKFYEYNTKYISSLKLTEDTLPITKPVSKDIIFLIHPDIYDTALLKIFSYYPQGNVRSFYDETKQRVITLFFVPKEFINQKIPATGKK